MKKAVLHTDGGARGNPGPAAIGMVLSIEGEELVAVGECIGTATNNIAEYAALKRGLELALERNVTDIKCYLDSELVVKQVKGVYRVKNQGLQPIFREVKRLADKFSTATFSHVRREKNKAADKLVNEALDKRS